VPNREVGKIEFQEPRSAEARATDDRAGVVVLGAEPARSYLAEYLQASDDLIRHAETHGGLHLVARPMFFLLRHAVELALKGTLERVCDIIDWTTKPTRPPVTKMARKHCTSCHDLRMLADDLAPLLAKLRLECPPQIHELVLQIAAFEGKNVTWSRYATTQDGKSAIERDTTVPLRDLASAVDDLIGMHLDWFGWDDARPNLAWRLELLWNSAFNMQQADETESDPTTTP